jgi:hypothetical protein
VALERTRTKSLPALVFSIGTKSFSEKGAFANSRHPDSKKIVAINAKLSLVSLTIILLTTLFVG